MAVIVVSRTLGSEGDVIARRVAEALEIPLLDKEIISRAAQMAGVSETWMEGVERVPPLLERMAELLGRYPSLDMTGMPPTVPVAVPMTTEWYRRMIEDLIRNIARTGKGVIIGHAAQVILKDFPNVLKVLIYAPMKTSVARVMVAEGLTQSEAEKRIRQSTRDRAEYIRLYYGAKWLDPEFYDLIINTELLDPAASATVILEAVRASERRLEPADMPNGR
jgi:hypothetical protein